jgi:outer membrane protein TolC
VLSFGLFFEEDMIRNRFIPGGVFRPALIITGICSWLAALAPSATAEPTNSTGGVNMTLAEYLRRVVESNETIQNKMLETEINRKKVKSEKGIFEPEWVTSVRRDDNHRDNNILQNAAQSSLFGGTSGESLFVEKNWVYDNGIDALVPSGAKLHFGYTYQELRNNLNNSSALLRTDFPTGEYQMIAGLNVTQPLLKGFGPKVAMAGIRLAALGSDIAFQEYRQALMETVARAEATYWEVYLTQEELDIANGSIKLAQTLLSDNKQRLDLGKAPEIEVLQAQAGIANRETIRNEAVQKHYDAVNRASMLFSGSVGGRRIDIRAVDVPQPREMPTVFGDHWKEAMDLNTEYLIRKKRLKIADEQLGVAKNQRLLQLDLKGFYGLEGVTNSPDGAFGMLDSVRYQSWSFGLELHIPLEGGIKTKAELQAAMLKRRQADLDLKTVETQLANGLDSALQKIRSYHDNVGSYKQVVDFNQKLLENQLARLEGGKSDSRIVLQTEEDLFKARITYLDAEVQYQRALLEMELIKGSMLRSRNLELTQRELADKTSMAFQGGRYTEAQYKQLIGSLLTDYDLKNLSVDSKAQDEAVKALRQKVQEMESAKPEEKQK